MRVRARGCLGILVFVCLCNVRWGWGGGGSVYWVVAAAAVGWVMLWWWLRSMCPWSGSNFGLLVSRHHSKFL